jgi:hypothetical protein
MDDDVDFDPDAYGDVEGPVSPSAGMSGVSVAAAAAASATAPPMGTFASSIADMLSSAAHGHAILSRGRARERRASANVDDGIDAPEATEATEVAPEVEDVVVEALDGKARGVRAFEEMCDEVIGTGAVAANATWQRAITKLQRDGRFKTALATHNERRGAFEGWKAKARDGLKKRSGSGGGDGGGEEGARKKTKYEREQAALRAREIEATRAREQAEYVAKKRKAETLEAEAERAFEALCAEKVKTYARSYDEAWTRDLQYDALGRNNVDALRGGELRARELFEAHRERVEKTLKSEFSKLCARVLDRLIVSAIDAGVGENKGTVDSIFAGALSYAKASEEEYELIDEAVFNLVPDADRASMWTSCASNILARHDIIVDTQEE